MTRLPFEKLEATGNDFVVLETAGLDLASLAPAICHRNLGVGADGLVGLQKVDAQTWSWNFFNCDGSKAAMCGNAARAVARYLIDTHAQTSGRILTEKLSVSFRTADNEISVSWPLAASPPKALTLNGRRAFWVDTGVPHFVVPVNDIEKEMRNIDWILAAKKHELAGEQSINVTLYHESHPGQEVQAITHERGVENFTLSCGTGAIAVAKVLGRAATVEVPGGRLKITFEKDMVSLMGPARKVFRGEYFVD